MSLERPATASTTQILGTLGSQVGISLATQVAVHLFHEWIGSSYSQANYRRHGELTRLYSEFLGREPPVQWQLDGQRRPKYRVRTQSWWDYARSLNHGKEQASEYHTQATSIGEHVTNYLSERARRWFGKGSPGDLLELFMSEWLEFAKSELLTYKYDETSITKLDARLRYLQKVQRHQDLFKVGFIRRRKDKFSVMESLRWELIECRQMAQTQALRECAREKFKVCRDTTTRLLLACINTIYYARVSPVHSESLNLRAYVDPDPHLPATHVSSYTKGLYARVKRTPTGALLQDVILMSGLEAFGKTALAGERPAETASFKPDFTPKPVARPAHNADLPKWLQDKEAHYLAETQKLAECVLRLARLKRLLEEVYDLTGKLGDVWAYGDRRGKLALKGLLFLLEKELGLFQERYSSLYEFQNTLRQAYTIRYHVRQDTPASLNFSRVDEEKEKIDQVVSPLKKAIVDLEEKMAAFSTEEVQRIDARKEQFYREVASRVQESYPMDFHRFELLVQPLTEEETVTAFGLNRPLLAEETVSAQESSSFMAACFGEESFAQWREKYFSRHAADYRQLASLLREFENLLQQPDSGRARAQEAGKIQEHLERMKKQAEAERPIWRLGWLFLNLGWPFKRGLNRKLNLVLQEFELLERDVRTSAESEAKTSQPGSILRSQRLLPNKDLSPLHYKNHKISIFNPKLVHPVVTGRVGEEKQWSLDTRYSP